MIERLDKLIHAYSSMAKQRATLVHDCGVAICILGNYKRGYKDGIYNEARIEPYLDKAEKQLVDWAREYTERKKQ